MCCLTLTDDTYVFVDDLPDFLEITSVHSGEDVLPVGLVDVDGCVVVSTDCCGAGGEPIREVIADSAEIDAADCRGVIGGDVELWDDLQRSEEMARRIGTNLAAVVVATSAEMICGSGSRDFAVAFTSVGTPEVSDDTRVEICVDSVDTELVSSWNASSVSFCLFLHIVISRDKEETST